jgi:hypothetical protein
MCLLLTLLRAAEPAAAEKVPALEIHLTDGKTDLALELLREIGDMKKNDAEAEALVKLIRNPRVDMSDEVKEASFVALQGIGSRKVTRDLIAFLKHSRLKKEPVVRIGVCRAISGSADPKGIETILDLLRDEEDSVVAAAAEAAGVYRNGKESWRKDLFQTVMDIYVGTWNLKNSVNPELKTEKRRAERKWEVVEKSMEKTLQLLSNVTQNDPPAWRHWWNKNKNTRWADLDQ